MPTVREATVCLMRELGMTTLFGNPGSTELPLFRDFPDDFRYVLGLQEVGGRRHGRRLRPGHAERGVREPALGRRRRQRHGQHLHRLSQPHAAGDHRRAAGAVDPALRAVPLRQRRGEAARAVREMGGRAGARRRRAARDRARLLPGDAGAVRPDVRLNPGGRLGPADGGAHAAHGQPRRSIRTRRSPQRSPAMLDRSQRPAFVVGFGVDRNDAWDEVVALAERHQALVWASPMSSRCSFPERHPLFAGFLPPMREQIVKLLDGHDLIVALGAPVFTYHIEGFGPHVPPGASLVQIIDDPNVAAWTPLGTALVCNVRLGVRGDPAKRPSPPNTAPHRAAARAPPRVDADAGLTIAFLMQTLADVRPADSIIVEESPSSRKTMQAHLPIERPQSFFTCASGGLGHSMPAAVGIALAHRSAQRSA